MQSVEYYHLIKEAVETRQRDNIILLVLIDHIKPLNSKSVSLIQESEEDATAMQLGNGYYVLSKVWDGLYEV